MEGKETHPQFQPRRASDVRAVVLANKKTPVSPLFREGSLSNVILEGKVDTCPRKSPACPAVRCSVVRRPSLRVGHLEYLEC